MAKRQNVISSSRHSLRILLVFIKYSRERRLQENKREGQPARYRKVYCTGKERRAEETERRDALLSAVVRDEVNSKFLVVSSFIFSLVSRIHPHVCSSRFLVCSCFAKLRVLFFFFENALRQFSLIYVSMPHASIFLLMSFSASFLRNLLATLLMITIRRTYCVTPDT